MPNTYAVIHGAYQALSPAPATLADAVAVMNAQTQPASVNVPATAVRDYLLTTGEWGALMLAIQPGSTATQQVQGIILSLKTLVDTGATVQSSIAVVRSSVTGWLGAMQTAGLLSAATVAALEAMWTQNVPVWSPPLTVGDLQTALGVL